MASTIPQSKEFFKQREISKMLENDLLASVVKWDPHILWDGSDLGRVLCVIKNNDMWSLT